MSPIGSVLKQVLRERGLADGMRRAVVTRAWKDALGPALSSHARVVALRDGELLVEVDSAAHLHELRSFTGERYRQIANRALGATRIRTVRFRPKR